MLLEFEEAPDWEYYNIKHEFTLSLEGYFENDFID